MGDSAALLICSRFCAGVAFEMLPGEQIGYREVTLF